MSTTRFDNEYLEYYWQPVTDKKIPMPKVNVSYAPEVLKRKEAYRLNKLAEGEKCMWKRLSLKMNASKCSTEL